MRMANIVGPLLFVQTRAMEAKSLPLNVHGGLELHQYSFFVLHTSGLTPSPDGT